MKVSIFDKRLMNIFYAILSGISVITSIEFVFIEMDKVAKTIIGVSLLIKLVLTYLFIWIYWNKKKSIHLKVNNSKIEVKFGDIFAESADFKVAAKVINSSRYLTFKLCSSCPYKHEFWYTLNRINNLIISP